MKVPYEKIKELLSKVNYVVYEVNDRNIRCTSFINGYELASTKNSTIDPSEFNKDLGLEYVKQECARLTEEKLWEYEGYCLFKELNIESTNTPKEADYNFKLYNSKPIVRKAIVIEKNNLIKLDNGTYNYICDKSNFNGHCVLVNFVAHQEVVEGDYIVYLNDKDIYHCSKEVFEERNFI